MSYILEALRKADQEREAGAVPDLESVHQVAHPAPRSMRWIWILVALLVVNGVLMVLLATRDTGTAVPRQASGPASGPGQESADAAPPATPVVAAAVPSASTAARAVSVPKTAPNKVPPKVDRPVPSAPAIPPVTAVVPAAKPAASAPVVQTAPGKAPPPVIATAAPVPRVSAEAAGQGLRDWEDLDLEFRSGLYMPRLDVHVYDDDPQRRFVLIALRKYRAGDRLENGVVIEEILPDGLKMSYQGTHFRYRK